MYRVNGKILVKESQAPIPNLQVVLYDLDPQQEVPRTHGVQQGLSSQKERPAQLFWAQFPGERLGSVLTNADGGFEIAFDDEAFQVRRQEEKPDLFLLVLAPEDTVMTDQSTIPRPLPTAERVLHYSFGPVVDSGRQESYIIRIPREQLDAFEIPYPFSSSQTAEVTKETIAADLRESAELRASLNGVMTEQRREMAESAIALKKRADEAFSHFTLSAVPQHIRSQSTYLNPDDALPEMQTQLVNDALARIPESDGAAGVRRRVTFTATESQVEEWGLTRDATGTVSGEVDAAAIVNEVKKLTSPSQLEFADSTLAGCRNRLEAERRFREALERCAPASVDENGTSEANGDDDNGAPEDWDTLDFTTEAFVRANVARQLEHAKAPEVELTYGVERDGEITATITKAGPADVTAYHDFHELHIAFDYIWREAFDETITDVMKELYAEAVRYSNQVSGVPEEVVESLNEPVQSVNDMQRLYKDIRLLQRLIEEQNKQERSTSEGVPLGPVPTKVKRLLPEITDGDWSSMELSEQEALKRLADEYDDLQNYDEGDFLEDALAFLGGGPAGPGVNAAAREARKTNVRSSARAILAGARERARSEKETSTAPPTLRRRKSNRLGELMVELDERLSERYKFDIFAPNSINYGILLAYRQAWTPLNYQVGDLVSTIPLAPKEVRRYSKKRVIKKSRSQKELEDAQSSRRAESASTSRADSEIVKRATNRTSFQQTAEGTLSVGVFEGRFGTQFGIDAEKASSSTKKNFREAVVKAAEEYKRQHRVEVETTISEELEFVDSGEISNPNDEITVTYLFYELQRQYDVMERIYRLTPVILVANDVPMPHEIDEDWLMAHHWILRRVILDDAYLPALDYVTTSFLADEMALEVMWSNLQRQANLVDELVDQLKTKKKIAEDAFRELKRLTGLIKEKGDLDKFKDINLAAAFGPFAIAGMIGDDSEATEKREEIAKLAIERADKEVQQASAKLSREVAALQEAIDKYTEALREHLDRQATVTALRIHIKDNILCYMHRIWDHECSDERFFRLYNVEVPWIEFEEHTITVSSPDRRDLTFGMSATPDPIRLEGELTLTHARIVNKKLSEVADLDNLLGYKGNYMIFAVKEPNHLHWYMMQDYVDASTGGLRDPDEYGNYTTDDLIDFACCLRESGVEESDERFEQVLNSIRERAMTPRKESELIIVPTDSLYIEALPGKHPVLEDFKLVHRAIDVKKVQAEVRHAEIENVRLAARLLEEELGDPDIETRIQIEGGSDVHLGVEGDE